ncbi:MAG: hypothetical protein JSV05_09635 [Candidatus Bathyarchaeota archaeon]|nr:MAG: hypothetical protein JSV05_09635 [Candidatus Bathyarchaeota archaeon]
MRSHIVTDLERKIITQYLWKKEKLEGFRMLKMRTRQHYKQILDDTELIIEFVEALRAHEGIDKI